MTDMKNVDIKVGPDGDIAIENGDLVLVDGIDAIRQAIQFRLRLFRGELPYHPAFGMPYFSRILTGGADLEDIRSIYRTTIADTPGVSAVTDLRLDLDRAARVLRVRFRATADTGESVSDALEIEL